MSFAPFRINQPTVKPVLWNRMLETLFSSTHSTLINKQINMWLIDLFNCVMMNTYESLNESSPHSNVNTHIPRTIFVSIVLITPKPNYLSLESINPCLSHQARRKKNKTANLPFQQFIIPNTFSSSEQLQPKTCCLISYKTPAPTWT